MPPYYPIPQELQAFRAIGHSEAPFAWDNPDDFEMVIQRCWAFNPDERPEASELVKLLG